MKVSENLKKIKIYAFLKNAAILGNEGTPTLSAIPHSTVKALVYR